MKPVRPPRVPLRHFLLLHAALLLFSVVSIFAKLAGLRMSEQNLPMTLWMLGLEAFTLLIYSVLWQQVLKRMPLGFAYSNKGVCTLWISLFGVLFFGETFTPGKAIGLAVVLFGVWLVVTEHE